MFSFFYPTDRPTQPFEVEGDGKRNILLGWPLHSRHYFTSSNCICMQLQGIVFIQLQGNDIPVNCKEINSFKGHIFIHKMYNHSRQLYSFTESDSFQGTYQFCLRNVSSFKENIFIQGHYIHSKIYTNLRNIYSFKFKAICSFKETIFTEHSCVRGHSRNIYSKIVPSHFMIIINFTITISWIKYSYNSFRLKDEEIADMIEGSVL